MTIALVGLAVIGFLFFVFWCLATEFSYFSPWAIRLFYKFGAKIYGKTPRPHYSEEVQRKLLLEPLLQACSSPPSKVIDLCTGTGRIPLLLLRSEKFNGQIRAVDLSPHMLQRLDDELRSLPKAKVAQVKFAQANVNDWQPAGESYDAVSILQASEFIPDFADVISKVAAALKPDGLFLLTRPGRSRAWAFPGRPVTQAALRTLLTRAGFQKVTFTPWFFAYEVIQAWKTPKRTVSGLMEWYDPQALLRQSSGKYKAPKPDPAE